jgi:glucosamine--fructose-6-phosphate aminotransferase (isomerizing)
MSNFLKEIKEQPEALKKLVSRYSTKDIFAVKISSDLLLKQKTVIFTGMGASYYSPLFIRDKISSLIKMLNVEAGELFHYNLSLIKKDDPIVIISQSGESIEIKNIVDSIKDRAKIIAITNNILSTLGTSGEVLLPLYAGSELSISNKTYTNTLAVLELLAHSMIGGDFSKIYDRLNSTAEAMEKYLSDDSNIEVIKEYSKFLVPLETAHFIGRGPNLVSAYQAGLIFMEGAKCYAHGFSAGAFRHGPMELSRRNHRAIIFAPEGTTYDLNTSLTEELILYGSRILLVTNGQYRKEHENIRIIHIPAKSEESFAYLAAVVFEMLLVYVSRLRGYIAGHFDIAQKITTRE